MVYLEPRVSMGLQHPKLVSILENSNLDKEDVNLIQQLYWNQKANVRIGDLAEKRYCTIQKGAKLLNVYVELIMLQSKLMNTDFRINGQKIQNISYADAIKPSWEKPLSSSKERSFSNMDRVLKERKLTLRIRMKILQCCVWFILRHAAETWIMTKDPDV